MRMHHKILFSWLVVCLLALGARSANSKSASSPASQDVTAPDSPRLVIFEGFFLYG